MGYDVIIVGAGSAGGVMADRLSAGLDRYVLLLEAGPDLGSSAKSQPAELIDPDNLTETSYDWGYVSEPDVGRRRIPLFAGRVVGGSSATNNAMALRGQPGDFDAWAAIGDQGLSFAELLPYFRKVERDLDFTDDFHGDQGPVPIRRPDKAELTPLQAAFTEACQDLGHPAVDDHNRPGAVGVGPMPFNRHGDVRQSTALTYLAEARQRPNLTVRGNASVEKVIMDGTRAVGVRLAESAETIRADLIIVAAGAYGSPMILLRSGIGPADDLRNAGIDTVIDLPGVGRNLHDHPLLRLPFGTTLPEAAPPLQTLLTCSANEVKADPDLQIFPAGPQAVDGESLGHLVVALIAPRSRGTLRIRPDRRPAIMPRLLDHPADLADLVAGIRIATKIATAERLAPMISPQWPAHPDATDAELATFATSEVASYQHPVGTCRMGPAHQPSAVTDPSGAVHGVDGLSVVDASTMPTIPRANTNLPTLMLAERFAAALA